MESCREQWPCSDIGCVVVTYNRLEKLKNTLRCYESQGLLPRYVIVVDNASTDGTYEYLEGWKEDCELFDKIVIHSEENGGGSGGFYLGEEESLKRDADWVMLADDDAYPEPNYLKGIQDYIDAHNADEISVVCGKVLERGSPENIHRSRWRKKWSRKFHRPVKAYEYEKSEFYPDFVSYVGIVVNKEKLNRVGLVDPANFIWCDDTEHAYRLSRVGRLVCLPPYTMVHDVDIGNEELSWKSYYGVRNDLVFFKKHFPSRYPFVLLKMFIKTVGDLLKGHGMIEAQLRFAAMKDSLVGNMGKNDRYKPGWKP